MNHTLWSHDPGTFPGKNEGDHRVQNDIDKLLNSKSHTGCTYTEIHWKTADSHVSWATRHHRNRAAKGLVNQANHDHFEQEKLQLN